MKAAVRTETDKGKRKKNKIEKNNQNPSQPGMEIMYFKVGALLEDSS